MRYLALHFLFLVSFIIIDYHCSHAGSPKTTRGSTRKRQLELAEEARLEELVDILFQTTPVDPQSLNPFEVAEQIEETLEIARRIKVGSSRVGQRLGQLRQVDKLKHDSDCSLDRLIARNKLEQEFEQNKRLHAYLDFLNQNCYEKCMKQLQVDLVAIRNSIKLPDIHKLREFVQQEVDESARASMVSQVPFESLPRALVHFSEQVDGRKWEANLNELEMSKLLATISDYAIGRFDYQCRLYEQLLTNSLAKYDWLVSHMSFYLIDLDSDSLELLECGRICQEFSKIPKLNSLISGSGSSSSRVQL